MDFAHVASRLGRAFRVVKEPSPLEALSVASQALGTAIRLARHCPVSQWPDGPIGQVSQDETWQAQPYVFERQVWLAISPVDPTRGHYLIELEDLFEQAAGIDQSVLWLMPPPMLLVGWEPRSQLVGTPRLVAHRART